MFRFMTCECKQIISQGTGAGQGLICHTIKQKKEEQGEEPAK